MVGRWLENGRGRHDDNYVEKLPCAYEHFI
jgi:hypothetical protein